MGVQYKNLIAPAALIGASLIICIIISKRIELLCLGESTASALGVNIKSLRIVCIILASVTASSVISFAGLIGFIGLIVPHIARLLCGHNIRSLFVCSAFLGGTVSLLADLVGRIAFMPSELPVGITLAFVGVPFFIAL